MNEYQWYEETNFSNDEAYAYTENTKKTLPIWLISLITSVISAVILLSLFAFFVLPYLRTPTTIHYSSPSDSPSLGNTTTPLPDNNIGAVAEKCSQSCVYISSTGIVGGFFNQHISLGSGSGIIISNDGYIITSSSVVNSGTDIEVTLNDSKSYSAMLVGSDPKTDIAILKIEAQNLTPAVLGSSDNIKTGDSIITIGNQLGSQIPTTVTSGRIAGINKNVTLQNGEALNLIQVDANISSGNVGGPILNTNGEIVGIIIANVSSGTRIALAMPVNDIKPIISNYLNTGDNYSPNVDSSTPMIGITGTNETYGVVVESVGEDTPASKAKLKVGDIIIKADNTPVNTVEKINEIRMTHEKGDTITLTIFRNGETMEIPVVLE